MKASSTQNILMQHKLSEQIKTSFYACKIYFISIIKVKFQSRISLSSLAQFWVKFCNMCQLLNATSVALATRRTSGTSFISQ